MKTNTVSIVIPTKNEERTITDIVKSVKQYGNVIVVDGHSSDNTIALAELAGADKIVLDSGKGKGSGIQKAIEISDSSYILFFDADGSHLSEDIPKLIENIKSNGSSMCIGSRALGGSEELSGADFSKFIRVTGSALITLIINWRFGTKISDSQNGFRILRTDVAKSINLKENSFAVESEMLIKVLKAGYRVTEVPSKELKRKYGESNINLKKMWYRYVACVLRNII